MINLTSATDKIIRIFIFTMICLVFSKTFAHFEYSLVSFAIIGFTFAAICLPPTESIIVFIFTIVISILFPDFIQQKIMVLNLPIQYNIDILYKILLNYSIIPVIVFAILKSYYKSRHYLIHAFNGLFISWLIYFCLVPIVYAVRTGYTTEEIYLPLFKYLFASNIIIYIFLSTIILILGSLIWIKVEDKRRKVREMNQK